MLVKVFLVDFRTCNDTEDFKKYIELVNSKDFVAKNKYRRNCKETTWSIMNTGDASIKPFEKVEKLVLEAIKPEIIYRKEIRLYSSNDLIADIGGYLGLLLGSSIPGIISFLQTFLKSLNSNGFR